MIKPIEKKSVQETDIEQIVQRVIEEGYSGDALTNEIAYRVKKYNDMMNRHIKEFLNDMESDSVLENDEEEIDFNGLDIL